MGELTIRRNRGFAVPPQPTVSRTEKQSGSTASRKASGSTGLTVSESLRQLMSRETEVRTRESRRTLQKGEAVLSEVQDRLGRIAELLKEAEGETDGGALQSQLDQLREEIDRMIGSAIVGGTPLFLGEDLENGVLPDWLTNGTSQMTLTPEQLLAALGLDKTASGAELLAAVTKGPLGGGSAADTLAALYLGAVIAGGDSSGPVDLNRALDGLRQLLEQVSRGVSPDQAVEALTDGEFASLADFESQFTSGAAPGLEAFLTNLLLSGEVPPLLTAPSLMPLLAGLEGMNLDLMMELLTAGQSSEPGIPADAVEAADAEEEAAAPDHTAAPASTVQYGELQVTGQDLSGISFDGSTGVLTVAGTADVVIQGTGAQEIQITGSGTVTLQDVTVPLLNVDTGAARIYSGGETVLSEVQLRDGASLELGGGGLLRIADFRADADNVLRLTGGAVVITGKDGQGLGNLTVPVVLDGPASLAAQAAVVRDAGGNALEPFDVIWKTLLPGFASVTSMALDGRQAKMVLMGGDLPTLARLWLDKGDPSHGYPAHTLVIQGRDEFGRPRTRYAYLLWSRRAGAFEEGTMYPNPFTVTGGEPDQDWVYEEGSGTLRILSNQVTAISGGSGTDANQLPFSGRIALADGIGVMELTLGGVACRVSAGRAFHLGQENDVTLLLESGTSNFFESGAGCAGISLGDGTSLRIDCVNSRSSAGMLTAAGGAGGAGIGRDSGESRDQTSHILIVSGTIIATGTGGGAGIGAGKHGFMGPITIRGGTVTSTGGRGGGAGIGGALGAPVGDITIRGGTVTAIATEHAAAIGAGVQGASGNILITGTARIAKARGGNPGADIGACLFGGCGKVLVSGGADIGKARLWTRPGVSLQIGEDTVTLPQFRLSARALGLDALRATSREAARATIDADRRWVSQIQTAYSALYNRLEQGGFYRVPRERPKGPVRDTAAAGELLRDTRQSILRQAAQAMRTHGSRGSGDVGQLLR